MNNKKPTTKPFKSIKQSLLTWLLVISLLPLIVAVTFNYNLASNQINQQVINNLIDRAYAQGAYIRMWFDYRFMDVKDIASSPTVVQLLTELKPVNRPQDQSLLNYIKTPSYQQIIADKQTYFEKRWLDYDYISDILLLDDTGNVIFTLAEHQLLGSNVFNGPVANSELTRAIQQTYSTGRVQFSDLFHYPTETDPVSGFVTALVIDKNGDKIGTLALQLKLDRVQQLVNLHKGLGEHYYILNGEHELKLQSNSIVENFISQTVNLPSDTKLIENSSASDAVQIFDAIGLQGTAVLTTVHSVDIADVTWFVVNETEKGYAFSGNDKIITISISMLVLTTILIAVFSIFISSQLTQPIEMLSLVVQKFKEGKNLSHNLVYNNNEIGLLSKAFNELIKERKRHDSIMSETLEVQQAILDNLGEGLIMIDANGNVLKFSRSAEKLFKYTAAEMIGKNINILMPQHVAIHHDHYLQTQNDNVSRNIIDATRTVKGVNKNGKEFDMELVVTKIKVSDKKYFIGLVRDVTARQKTQRKLVKALEEADIANQTKNEFLANMSHEIRTPLNGIYGSLQLIEDKVSDPKVLELIENAAFSCRSLLTIITDILDFSKIESGLLNLDEKPFEIDKIIKLVLHEIHPIAKQKSLEVIYDQSEGFRDGWVGDPIRIKQIVTNLISNAVKFTEHGSVKVTVLSDLDSWGNSLLRLHIFDTGIGMSKAGLERVFKRFEQADSSATRKYGGTGLGMAITKNLLQLMNGEIDIKSEPNVGTQVYLTLPLPSATIESKDNAKGAAAKPTETKSTPPDLRGKTILLAEDNMINTVVFQTMMKPTNATIITAENGKLAVDAFIKHNPDLIFMDIQMPEMDGVTACLEIRKIDEHYTPVIALTANVTPEDIRTYEKNGFDGHIGKPIDLSLLYDMTRKNLPTVN